MATYPGKKKLIACGFHEATLAAYAACDYAFPGKTIHLQYTTTSPRLLQKFGDQSTLSTRSSVK
jgi:thioredoxin reductase (NADPH)